MKPRRPSAKPATLPPGRYTKFYSVIRSIPRGKVASYGQVARLAGLEGRARLVGYALRVLPESGIVPWFRVIGAAGKISFPPASAEFQIQSELLKSEGINVTSAGRVDMRKFGWKK